MISPARQRHKKSPSAQHPRQPRSERREALVLISKALFARLDLVSLCCGHRSPTGFSDVSMRELMSLTGLTQRRCERSIAMLKRAGFVEVAQPRERNSQGRYYGLRAIRVVTDFFFACLGLDRILKREKAKAAKRLESLGWARSRFNGWKKFFRGKMGTPPAARALPWTRQGTEPHAPRDGRVWRPDTWCDPTLEQVYLENQHAAGTNRQAQQTSLTGRAGGIIPPARQRQKRPDPDLVKRWNQALNRIFLQFPDISEQAARHYANTSLGLPLDFCPT